MGKYESAKNYEKNFDIQEAIEEYRNAILDGEYVQESKIAILRLEQMWMEFDGVDKEKKLLFEMANTQEDIEILEGWLLR